MKRTVSQFYTDESFLAYQATGDSNMLERTVEAESYLRQTYQDHLHDINFNEGE